VAAVGVGVYFLAVKKNDDEAEIKDEVYTIRYWNHMMASPQKTLTKTLKPGTAFQATVSESGLSNVSQQYIAARYPDMGKLLGFGQDGTVSVVTASKNNTIDVYCFDMTDVTNEQLTKIAGMSNPNPSVLPGRHSKWYKRHFNNQPDTNLDTWYNAFKTVNDALQKPFIVGSCSYSGGTAGTDFSWGWGDVGGGWGDKSYNNKYIITDLNKIIFANKGLIFAQDVNVEEIGEGIPGLLNIGPTNSKDVICTNGLLNRTGVSLMRYAAISRRLSGSE
jgi:hypothetical protein